MSSCLQNFSLTKLMLSVEGTGRWRLLGGRRVLWCRRVGGDTGVLEFERAYIYGNSTSGPFVERAYIYGNFTSGPFVGLVSRRWLGVSVVYFGFCFVFGICMSLGMFVVIARTNRPFNRASLPGRRGCISDNFFVYLLTPHLWGMRFNVWEQCTLNKNFHASEIEAVQIHPGFQFGSWAWGSTWVRRAWWWHGVGRGWVISKKCESVWVSVCVYIDNLV